MDAEHWVLKGVFEQQLGVFQREVMRKIGPIKNQDEGKINEEIDFLIKHVDIIRYIQAQIIK
jgi:hypothetical protein